MGVSRRLNFGSVRHGLAAIMAMVCITLLTACQPTDISDNATTKSDTRQVADATGFEIAIPTQPERIVTLSELDLDALLVLGIKPVGSTAGRGQQGVPRYLDDQSEGIELVGALGRPNLDRIIGLSPDLILVGGITDPMVLEQLRKIAPTVVTYKLGDNWKTAFSTVADMVGRQQQADQFMDDYRQRVAQVKAELGEQANAKVSIVRWIPQGPGYMLSQSFASLVLQDLQLARPEIQQQDGIAHSNSLSLEALDKIDGDWLFVGTLSTEGDAVDAMKAASSTPVFQQLNAVKNNRLVPVDGSLWTSLGGPQAAMAILDDVEAAMTDKAGVAGT